MRRVSKRVLFIILRVWSAVFQTFFKLTEMRVDISFAKAKVYNVDRMVDVVVGEVFSIFTDSGIDLKFFSDNDQVLDLQMTAREGKGTAKEVGTSTILIMDQGYVVHKQLEIRVVDAIIDPATNLNVSFGQPEPKV